MVKFTEWCNVVDSFVGPHALRILSGNPAQLQIGIDRTANAVPGHYAAEGRVAGILARLGKPEAAAFVSGKLPTSKKIKSGDLGEILATEFIATETSYLVPIKRLRWKDHRNMAMRGDDVIGMRLDPATGGLQFLKTEAKSRAVLGSKVIGEAREALDKDGGLPSAHALSFISDRLAELGNHVLADAITDAQLKHGIQPQSVGHLLFTFSGNCPRSHLNCALQNYAGPIAQWSVGLRVELHATFIVSVYDQVNANALR